VGAVVCFCFQERAGKAGPQLTCAAARQRGSRVGRAFASATAVPRAEPRRQRACVAVYDADPLEREGAVGQRRPLWQHAGGVRVRGGRGARAGRWVGGGGGAKGSGGKRAVMVAARPRAARNRVRARATRRGADRDGKALFYGWVYGATVSPRQARRAGASGAPQARPRAALPRAPRRRRARAPAVEEGGGRPRQRGDDQVSARHVDLGPRRACGWGSEVRRSGGGGGVRSGTGCQLAWWQAQRRQSAPPLANRRGRRGGRGACSARRKRPCGSAPARCGGVPLALGAPCLGTHSSAGSLRGRSREGPAGARLGFGSAAALPGRAHAGAALASRVRPPQGPTRALVTLLASMMRVTNSVVIAACISTYGATGGGRRRRRGAGDKSDRARGAAASRAPTLPRPPNRARPSPRGLAARTVDPGAARRRTLVRTMRVVPAAPDGAGLAAAAAGPWASCVSWDRAPATHSSARAAKRTRGPIVAADASVPI
jgi:hypothetical protein